MNVKPIFFLALLISCPDLYAKDLWRYQTGDIIFQSTPSKPGKAIELATHSKFSHVGVVMYHNGSWTVFEARQPVGFIALENFIQRDAKQRFEVLRLKKSKNLIGASQREALLTAAKTWEGKNYDNAFSWTDDTLYCSELVYKLYDQVLHIQLAQLKPLKSFDLSHPLVQEQLKVKYGDAVPLNDPMISPEQIYQSPLLRRVANHG